MRFEPRHILRAKYVEIYLNNLVDWNFVAKKLRLSLNAKRKGPEVHYPGAFAIVGKFHGACALHPSLFPLISSQLYCPKKSLTLFIQDLALGL